MHVRSQFVAGMPTGYNVLMSKLSAALVALILTFAPLTARADDASSLGPPTTGTAQGGSSNADSSSLQPAGTSPLQSATNDSTGLTAPDSSQLQAPVPSDQQLQVISGDADGGPQQLSSSTQWWLWAGFTLLFALIAAAAVWAWRRRGHRRHFRRTAEPEPQEQEPNEGTPAVPTEPTTSQRLNITIAKPAGAVFEFLLNPGNTHKWIAAITEEEASDNPPHVGTIYRNRDASGHWTDYELTQLTEGESFELVNHTNNYHVRYTLTPEGDDSTYLEYFESVDDGQLENPFTQSELDKLKNVLETPAATEKAHHGQA